MVSLDVGFDGLSVLLALSRLREGDGVAKASWSYMANSASKIQGQRVLPVSHKIEALDRGHQYPESLKYII